MSRIHVCPLSGLEKTLEDTRARWMVSLLGPGKSVARPDQITGGYLALEFNDISQAQDGLVPPNEEHIKQLLRFFDEWNRNSPLVIHCWMGISRSTAAALLACARFNPVQDMEHLAGHLREQSPMATPNRLMIEIGDHLLGLDGRLAKAVQNIGRGADAFEGIPFAMDVAS